MPFTILHFSDLHLDAAFAGSRLPAEIARQCREQLRSTLRAIVDLARQRQVNAVTIAGDLFEREKLNPDTAAFLAQECERLAPIPVYIAPGNHDAADAASLYQRGRWPENVRIAVSHALSEWRLTGPYSLWSAAHLSPSDRHNFLSGFVMPAGASGRLPILLLHASLAPANFEGSRSHAPLTLNDIRGAGFALALLGHYHTRKVVQEEGVLAVYSGSPEPLGFQEPGEHGVTLVHLEAAQKPVLEFIALARLHFATLELSVTGCRHRDQLIERILVLAGEGQYRDKLVRLRLTGEAAASLRLELEAITRRVEKSFGFLYLENDTRPAIDLSTLASEPTVRGAFIRDMLAALEQAQEAEQRALYQEALDYGMQAFEHDDITLR
ncbi:MAG: DNA repair exonuclease [candidate division KSB1 bacterium]|nr:DNA repair exonuclease [candidate division KSB1 bacterium]MDZ7275319.1 DNA repair exonuclease [candidate division KSB1 bacterium]MDZ7287486.1 DNA repair exonuclease [candidate division KSB1 bacterium]MDZ7299600.1 DNA repair exonuclease [candidate division KSB1 bacterium]MDZ7307462.1 DNA repair exonuclease [candidate division KSB1 bacterium]